MFVCAKQHFFVLNKEEEAVYRTAAVIVTQSILESEFFVAFHFLGCLKAYIKYTHAKIDRNVHQAPIELENSIRFNVRTYFHSS